MTSQFSNFLRRQGEGTEGGGSGEGRERRGKSSELYKPWHVLNSDVSFQNSWWRKGKGRGRGREGKGGGRKNPVCPVQTLATTKLEYFPETTTNTVPGRRLRL